MDSEALRSLLCPYCDRGLNATNSSVRCSAGHTFNIARQGYLSLLRGDANTRVADTAEMVTAREGFLAQGHYDELSELIAELATDGVSTDRDHCIIDAGAGTGYYSAQVLDRLAKSIGLALDISKHALRRAARDHPRQTAIACDIWWSLPIRENVADLLLNIFSPRNGSEFHRVLRPSGRLLVVIPRPLHLVELVDSLDLLQVDPNKDERVQEELGSHFIEEYSEYYERELILDRNDIGHLVSMGPSALHIDQDDLKTRIDRLPDQTKVTLSLTLSRYRPR